MSWKLKEFLNFSLSFYLAWNERDEMNTILDLKMFILNDFLDNFVCQKIHF